MKFVTLTALAALVAGGIGAVPLAQAAGTDAATTTPAAPPAVTAPAVPGDEIARADENGPGPMGGHFGGPRGMLGGPGGGQAGLLGIACGDQGAEALEIAFVRIDHRIQPNATQQPLFDALKTTALADQKTFADACKTAMGTDPQKSNILDRMQAGVSIDTARLTAINDVLPKFKAFYDSLTDDQKAKLEPRGGERMGENGGPGQWGQHGWHRGGPNGQHMHGGPNGGPGQPADAPLDGQDAPAPATQS